MGDENPIRTLGDYSRPRHEGYRNTIELPEGNNVCEIDCAFGGKLRNKNADESCEIIKNLALYDHEGCDRTMMTPGNAEKPIETKTEMPVMEVEEINEVKSEAKIIKTSENDEAVEALSSQPVAYYIKHKINEGMHPTLIATNEKEMLDNEGEVTSPMRTAHQLCMKRKNIMMSLLIQGVDIYDAYKKERFKLFVMIYYTINDFPANGNLSGKTKDGVNARKDMVEMGIRNELAPQVTKETKMYLPSACYTLSKAKKTLFCKCLHGVKVPFGYSANIKNLVSMKDLKLLGMKSYDCHVLLTQMIPIAIRGVMPPLVRQTIIKLCLFFNMIHSKVIDHEKLDELQRDIIIILCQLEMYFPPSFFDVMVHLMSHIAEKIKLAGPVFLRYMYLFERYMGFLKGYVSNRYLPEGSIVQGYVAKEVVQFCTNYMDDVADIGLSQPRHQGRLDEVGTIRHKDVTETNDDFEQGHFTVLQNMTCKVIRMSLTNVDADVIQLGFIKDDNRKNSYYDVVKDIWELDYTLFVIPLFKCKWVNNTRGVKVNSDGFTCVNLSTNGYLSYPFILAKQATQVFYVEDPKDKRWHIVLQSKQSIVGVDDVVDEDEYNKFDELPPFSIDVQSTDDVISDTLYLKSDHHVGHED
nr:hypothetical protein [Tanacetum cinerariifolium]